MRADHQTVLAVDPGSCKCGVAVVRGGSPNTVLHCAVIATEDLRQTLSSLCTTYSPELILFGNGTMAARLSEAARGLGDLRMADEQYTTLEARKRYFLENPPRGWRRLIPTSLQTPPEPVDGYVAVILAERYLASH